MIHQSQPRAAGLAYSNMNGFEVLEYSQQESGANEKKSGDALKWHTAFDADDANRNGKGRTGVAGLTQHWADSPVSALLRS